MIPRTTITILVACALGLGAVAPLSGCATGGVGSVKYDDAPQVNYERGLEQLKHSEWAAAVKYFSYIKRRFQFSNYAVLAELRMADAEFGAEAYLESVERYRLFVKLHPTHEEVVNGYCSYKIGEAFYRQLPGDHWILPPAYEKDQGSTEDAGAELARFLDRFPDSPYREKAQEIMVKVAKRLASHEWYVARYYWDRDKPMGTVLRLRRLLEKYRGVGFDEEALWLLGRAYLSVKMPDRARTTWQEIVDKYPQHARANDARNAMGKLPPSAATPSSEQPLPDPAGEPDPTAPGPAGATSPKSKPPGPGRGGGRQRGQRGSRGSAPN